MNSYSTQKTENNDIGVQFIDGKNIHERQESSDKMDCIIKLECNVCVESCRCIKTEDIDISDQFSDEENVYERRYADNVDTIIKCEADGCEYVIVEFFKEKKNNSCPISIISSKWMFESQGILKCYWPTYFYRDKQREIAVKEHRNIDKDRSLECAIRVKYNTDHYGDAEKKLQEIENELATSTASDNDELAVGKRIAEKKHFKDFYSDHFTDDDEIVIPPKIRKDSERRRKSPRGHGNVLSQASGSGVLRENFNLVEIPSTSAMSTDNGIMEQLKTNEGILKDILKRLHRIETNISNLCERAQNVPVGGNPTESRYDLETLETLNQLEEFERNLEDIQFFSKIIDSLGMIGGKNQEDVCRNILSKMLSKELGHKLNWTGRQQKVAFSKFSNFTKAILVAIRRHKGCENATQSEVDQTIKTWLRNLYERGVRSSQTQNI